jgi:predicted DNA-binding transcriptional regulator YafY
VVVGPGASDELRATAGRPPAELLRLVEEAFSAGVALSFQYVDRNGRRSERQVELHGLLVQAPVWYLLARDIVKAEPRVFRMDRVSAPRLVPGHRFKPDPKQMWAALPPDVDWKTLLR